MNQRDNKKLNLVQLYRESGNEALPFLRDFFANIEGGIDFVHSSKEALKLKDRDLVWWCGMMHNYHQHPDYSTENLLKTRKHFKNIALGYLNSQEYGVFKTWISNWADLLIVTNYMNPHMWENHPDRYERQEA
jgi:hypothetical protein